MHGIDILNNNVAWKYCVQLVHSMGMYAVFKIEMEKILQGMYTGIGAGRSGELNWLPVKCLESLFYFRLYSYCIFLNLETTVPGSFIGDFDKVTGHALLSYQRLETF
jgi:hypothetical protein